MRPRRGSRATKEIKTKPDIRNIPAILNDEGNKCSDMLCNCGWVKCVHERRILKALSLFDVI